MRTRIMYIEDKSGGLTGPCRIGRVSYSKSGRSLYYAGRTFQSLTGLGFKANYFDLESGDHFWISGPRRDGADGLYGRITQPEDVDPDVADAYWRDIRGLNPTPRRRMVTTPESAQPHSPSSKSRSTVSGRKSSRMAQLADARLQDILAETKTLRDAIEVKSGRFTKAEIRDLCDEGRR